MSLDAINVTGFLLLSQLMRGGSWLIDREAAEGYMPLVRQLRAGNFEPAAALFKGKKKENTPYAVAMSLEPGAKLHKASKYSSFDDAPQGSVAVIPVMGPMMSQDFCGALGTQTLGRLAQEADGHPNIVGHVFVFDTPGGTVAGTENFSNVIKGTQKPAVAFVQGMMASAGYWAGSSANHVMAGGQTTQIGSIGTMLQIMDSSKADKKDGNKTITVRADDSYDKNEAFIQLLAGNDQPVKEQLLNPMNAVFLSAVKANRAGKLPTGKNAENVLSGKVYLAADAVKYGLADSIGTFSDAVQLALKLAATCTHACPACCDGATGQDCTHACPACCAQGPSNDSPNSNQTQKMNFKASWGALLALVGLSATAAPSTPLTEASVEELNTRAQAQADQLVAANGLVATLTTERDTARTGLTAKETELATATTGLTAATTKVTELTAEVARLGKQPGAMGTEVVKKGEDEGNTPPAKDPIVDPKAAHNVLAAKYFN